MTITALNQSLKTIAAHNPQDKSVLLLGDCLELMADMPANSVHLIVTDPPYFLDRLDKNWDVNKITKSKSKAGVVGGLPTGMKFDKRQGTELQTFIKKLAKQARRVLCPGGFFISHLTVKPVTLLEVLIRMFTIEKQTVLDPFVGSGTTLLAARNTQRIGVGMEINDEYYKIAKKRLSQ